MKYLLCTCLAMALVTTNSLAQVSVSSDYDKDVDFTQFKTYKFTEEALNLPISDLSRGRLIEAITSEMATKGFSQTDDPDILLDITITAEQKERTTATTNYSSMNHYGAGYRYRWGPSFTTTDINVTEYVEGTIFLDFISSETNQLVWQGRGVGTVQENASSQKKDKRAYNGVAKILGKYPPKKN